jgi:hypothetical protein
VRPRLHRARSFARTAPLVLALTTAACGAQIAIPASPDSDTTDATPPARDASSAGDAVSPSDPNRPGTGTTTGGTGTPSDPPMRLTCHDVEARVGEHVALHADGPPRVHYQWSIELAPHDSIAQIALPDQPDPTFIADMPGEWLFRVVVFDGQSMIDRCDTRLVAHL